MSGIELEPLDGSQKVKITEKIVIGRGPFLQINDKRVSRKHAVLEINNEKLVLTPIHTNPCFYKPRGTGDKLTLKKDVGKELRNGDIFGLLPDKLYYKVLCKEMENGEEEEDDEEEERSVKKPIKKKALGKGQNSNKTLAMPVEKPRELPKWMQGAAKRIGMSSPAKKTVQSPSKRSTASNARTPRKTVKTKDPSDDEYEEEEVTPKKRRAPPKRKAKESSDEEFDELSDEEKPAKRTGRTASQKVAKYTDDYVLTDEEVEFSESEEDYSPSKRRGKPDTDEDFEMSEEDSPSDWEEERRGSSRKQRSPKGKSSKKRSGGRKGRRRSSGGTRRSSRSSVRKRKRYAESDESEDFEDFYDDEDNYKPRPSRRRAGKATKRNESSSEVEESEEETPIKKGKPTKRKESSSEAEESEEETPKKKDRAATKKKKVTSDEETGDEKKKKNKKKESRRSCMYGKKCYRKNPNHFEEFCHPGDESYDSEEAAEDKTEYNEDPSESEDDKKKKEKPLKEPKPLREKDKKSVLHNASDDDGAPNTYDYDDSFIDNKGQTQDTQDADSVASAGDDDSGKLSESEEEDVKQLVKDARSFLRNKNITKKV